MLTRPGRRTCTPAEPTRPPSSSSRTTTVDTFAARSLRGRGRLGPRLLMVDDASDDETGQGDGRNSSRIMAAGIEYWRSPMRQGLARMRNQAARLATTEWIVYLDADDWLDARFIANAERLAPPARRLDALTTDMRVLREGQEGPPRSTARVPQPFGRPVGPQHHPADQPHSPRPRRSPRRLRSARRSSRTGTSGSAAQGRHTIDRLPGVHVFRREHGLNKSKTLRPTRRGTASAPHDIRPVMISLPAARLAGGVVQWRGVRFVLVDRLVELEPGKRAVGRKTFHPDDEVFADHFPGYPIVPGVLITEAMGQTAGWLLVATLGFARFPLLTLIDSAKFRRHAFPGDELEMTATVRSIRADDYQVAVHASARGERIADARLWFHLRCRRCACVASRARARRCRGPAGAGAGAENAARPCSGRARRRARHPGVRRGHLDRGPRDPRAHGDRPGEPGAGRAARRWRCGCRDGWICVSVVMR